MIDNRLIMKESCADRFAAVKVAVEHLIRNKEKAPILVAIDGKAASGKTTLSYYLKELLDCNVFHMDDFFLQPAQRSKERLAQVGGNVDYERFKDEVLNHIMEKRNVYYRKYNCSDRTITTPQLIPFQSLNIIEGSYSMHPYFGSIYDLRIFMDISEEKQLANILKRNGSEMLKQFKEEWIPKENAYFEKYNILKGCITIEWEL